ALVKAVSKKAEGKGKPVGLLVSKTNPDARKLYDSLGFVSVGERPFAGEMMNHLMKN
ncbi:MAG: zinc ABC transporter permease, partial [Muribaculaceae bacterium]|nr:zinc ABC transporter permease [Muribaculaceae bacterium]